LGWKGPLGSRSSNPTALAGTTPCSPGCSEPHPSSLALNTSNISIAKKHLVQFKKKTYCRPCWKFAHTNVSEAKGTEWMSPLSLVLLLVQPFLQAAVGPRTQSRAPRIAPDILSKADAAPEFHRSLGNIFFLLITIFPSHIALAFASRRLL